MKPLAKRILVNLAYGVGTIAGIALLWWAIAAALDNELVLPSPWTSIAAGWEMLALSKFWRAFGMTVLRSVAAFVVSAVFALACALLARYVPPAKKILNIAIAIVRALPTVAVVLVLLLWISPRVAPAIVTTVVIFPMLYGSFLAAFDALDPRLVEMARVYRVPKKRFVKELLIPAALPVILPALGNNFSLSIKLMVAAEVLSGTAASLGGMMQEASAFYQMPRLYALVLVTVAVALSLEGITALIQRKAVRWL